MRIIITQAGARLIEDIKSSPHHNPYSSSRQNNFDLSLLIRNFRKGFQKKNPPTEKSLLQDLSKTSLSMSQSKSLPHMGKKNKKINRCSSVNNNLEINPENVDPSLIKHVKITNTNRNNLKMCDVVNKEKLENFKERLVPQTQRSFMYINKLKQYIAKNLRIKQDRIPIQNLISKNVLDKLYQDFDIEKEESKRNFRLTQNNFRSSYSVNKKEVLNTCLKKTINKRSKDIIEYMRNKDKVQFNLIKKLANTSDDQMKSIDKACQILNKSHDKLKIAQEKFDISTYSCNSSKIVSEQKAYSTFYNIKQLMKERENIFNQDYLANYEIKNSSGYHKAFYGNAMANNYFKEEIIARKQKQNNKIALNCSMGSSQDSDKKSVFDGDTSRKKMSRTISLGKCVFKNVKIKKLV